MLNLITNILLNHYFEKYFHFFTFKSEGFKELHLSLKIPKSGLNLIRREEPFVFKLFNPIIIIISNGLTFKLDSGVKIWIYNF